MASLQSLLRMRFLPWTLRIGKNIITVLNFCEHDVLAYIEIQNQGLCLFDHSE